MPGYTPFTHTPYIFNALLERDMHQSLPSYSQLITK